MSSKAIADWRLRSGSLRSRIAEQFSQVLAWRDRGAQRNGHTSPGRIFFYFLSGLSASAASKSRERRPPGAERSVAERRATLPISDDETIWISDGGFVVFFPSEKHTCIASGLRPLAIQDVVSLMICRGQAPAPPSISRSPQTCCRGKYLSSNRARFFPFSEVCPIGAILARDENPSAPRLPHLETHLRTVCHGVFLRPCAPYISPPLPAPRRQQFHRTALRDPLNHR